tara:strand:- start:58634 stop:58963 length:330 start_codon:yes stop_codon:yes gene_type:complete
VPRKPISVGPNIKPNPRSQKVIVARPKSVMFLMATLIEFLFRVRPDSRQRKPACINRTRAAEINTSRESRDEDDAGFIEASRAARILQKSHANMAKCLVFGHALEKNRN